MLNHTSLFTIYLLFNFSSHCFALCLIHFILLFKSRWPMQMFACLLQLFQFYKVHMKSPLLLTNCNTASKEDKLIVYRPADRIKVFIINDSCSHALRNKRKSNEWSFLVCSLLSQIKARIIFYRYMSLIKASKVRMLHSTMEITPN